MERASIARPRAYITCLPPIPPKLLLTLNVGIDTDTSPSVLDEVRPPRNILLWPTAWATLISIEDPLSTDIEGLYVILVVDI